ncbi:phage protease [Alicyclobacillus acidoterrestris]|uniref:phage protease n=1 Tax=Alicyclobacillus acidoterrestris TaxID=1450 RepID=UPI003F52B863
MKTLIDLQGVMFGEAANGAEQWIQIMKCGEWDYPGAPGGKIKITPKDLALFKDNFDKQVRGTDLAVDIDHNPGNGAVAWFKELEVRGDTLWARVKWTDEGEQLVRSGKYRYFSPEFALSWTDEGGTTHKDVLFGGALTNRPFLKNMQPIEFSEDGRGVVWSDNSDGSGDNSTDSHYDPDGDGDDDSTTDPDANPDWMQDVMVGITPWPSDNPDQQKQLMAVGATKEACDAAFSTRQKQLGNQGYSKMTETLVRIMFDEDKVANAHKSPPKGKPTDKSQYADPDHYKYPIDAKHIRAAVSYFNQSGQQSAGGYSDDQWASIGRKIAAAANKLIGPGHSFKDGKIESPSTTTTMDDNQELTPDDGVVPPHDPDDENAGKFSETHKSNSTGGATHMDPNQQTVSLSEFQAAQQKIQMLEKENRRVKMSETVNGLIREGKIVPAQSEKLIALMTELTDDQVEKFNEIMKDAKPVVTFGEIGNGGSTDGSAEDPKVMLSERTAKIRKENPNISLSEAANRAYKELTKEGIQIDLKAKSL